MKLRQKLIGLLFGPLCRLAYTQVSLSLLGRPER